MRALVTGGGGFLGGAIVRSLIGRGADVASMSRRRYDALIALDVPQHEVDLGHSPESIAKALAEGGIDTVFHCAARPGVWGPAAKYEHANVAGTRNVVTACLAAGVKRLILTSSPSVVFDGVSHVNAGPDLPYPAKYLAHYPRTKAYAERLVLEANGVALDEEEVEPKAPSGLLTTALRPHLIFGPGDPNLVPRLLDRADKGRLRMVGDPASEVSLTYVDNAAEAHVVAAEALVEDGSSSDLAGNAWFINNVEPVRLWEWINGVLKGTGRSPITRRISPRLAYAAGAVLEGVYRAVGAKSEPPMTRFVARQLSTSHSYDMLPFIHATGGRYVELVDMEDATARTIEDQSQARVS